VSRSQFFIITSAIVFLLERILPALVPWPIFIFPVFVIFFLLTSKNDIREISYIAVAAIVFDFFSGYHFGFMTLVTLSVTLVIFFFKTRFNSSSQSPFSLALYLLIFIFVFFAILSIKSNPRLILTQAPIVITETLILFVIFTLWFRIIRVSPKQHE